MLWLGNLEGGREMGRTVIRSVIGGLWKILGYPEPRTLPVTGFTARVYEFRLSLFKIPCTQLHRPAGQNRNF